MAISRWQPQDDLSNLHSMMDRFFGDLFENVDNSRNQTPVRRLPVDISENKDAYVIKAPVPGFKPEDVEVTFSDGVLTIKATHREEKQEKEGNYLRRELMFGNYVRQIMVPNDVKGENINASFDNGMLVVELPRAPRPQPAKIQVKPKDARQNEGSRDANRQPEMAGSSSTNKRS